MVVASGTTTTKVFGVGLVVPAIIVGLTRDVRRFADKSVGASGSSEVSVLVHGHVDHRGSRLPTGRSSGRGRCGSRVGLSELSGEGGKGAAALAFGLRLELDEEPEPGS